MIYHTEKSGFSVKTHERQNQGSPSSDSGAPQHYTLLCVTCTVSDTEDSGASDSGITEGTQTSYSDGQGNIDINDPGSKALTIAKSTSTVPSTSSCIHITPGDFRFGHNEGCDSSAGSVQTSPLSLTDYSATKNPKRELAKQHMLLPKLKNEPDYDVVTQWRNLKLYRICDAVPYLLGPRTIADRIHLIIEQGMAYKGNLSDAEGNPHAAFEFISDRDRALMTILFSASMTEDQCQRTENWSAQGLPIQNNKLRLYKDVKLPEPEVVHIDLYGFIHKAKEWINMPNPANAACDHPDAKNAWFDVVAKLRERNVDPTQIDYPLYHHLTMELEVEQLNTTIEQIQEWSTSGNLARRFKEWKDTHNAQLTSLRATNKENERKHGIYAKRFSHKHPTGIDAKMIQIEEKHEPVVPVVVKKEVTNIDKAKKTLRTGFIIVLFAGLIAGLIYAMMNSISHDFTQPEGPPQQKV